MAKAKNILKIVLIYSIVFIATLIIASLVLNREVNNKVVESDTVGMPVMYVKQGSYLINEMFGYVNEIDSGYLRDSITPVIDSNSISFVIKENGHNITQVRYILRDSINEATIEQDNTFEEEVSDINRQIKLTISEALKEGEEYCLTVVLTSGEGEEFYYYTRLKQAVGYYVDEKIQFVREFCTATFNEDNKSEIEEYLETSKLKDNTSFTDVDITSSITTVLWGDMAPVIVSDIYTTIKEISENTATIQLTYRIQTDNQDESLSEYMVSESYAIALTSEQTYLRGFNRSIEEIADIESFVISDNMLKVGIVSDETLNFSSYISEDMTHVSFVVNGQLLSYNVTDNMMTQVFRSENQAVENGSGIYNQHGIKTLKMDTNGDIYFIVYGYMYEGDYEGQTGTIVYKYNHADNSLEELLYIPTEKSWEMLKLDIEKLSFMNNDYDIYMLIGDTIYMIDYKTKEASAAFEKIETDSYMLSEDGKVLLIGESSLTDRIAQIRVLYLETGEEKMIESPGNDIKLFGFYDNDIVYGIAEASKVQVNGDETVVMPMNHIYIIDTQLNVVKEYDPGELYIIGVSLNESSIEIELAKEVSNDGIITYEEISKDYLLNNKEEIVEDAEAVKVYDSIRLNETHIQFSGLKDTVPITQVTRALAAGKDVSLIIENTLVNDRYYLFTRGRLFKEFTSIASAILAGGEYAGTVVSSNKSILWQKDGRASEADTGIETIGTGDSLTMIIEALCNYEGEQTPVITAGMTVMEALEANLSRQAVSLNGIGLSDVLDFVSRGRPVIVQTDENTYVMIVGYNESYLFVANPEKGTVSDWNYGHFKDEFKNKGNLFYSYY